MSKPHENELWVIILEKAWAKVHGTYMRIQAGFAYEAFRDLLGAPAYGYKTKEEKDMFKIMLKANEKKYMLCASC